MLVKDLQDQAPDHTVVTGDLTQIGLPEEFIQARDWLHGLGDAGAVTVIPGNHDQYVAERWEQSFALWCDYLASDDAEGWSAGAWPSLRVRGPVAIIGLNSAFPADWLRAVGRVGADQRARLGRLVEGLGGKDLFRLALVHHAPVPGIDPWRKRLLDCTETALALAAGQTHLVLHGHDHRASFSSIAATPAIPAVAVPSASFGLDIPGKLAAYNIYRVQKAADGWRVRVEVRGLRNGAVAQLDRRELAIPVYA